MKAFPRALILAMSLGTTSLIARRSGMMKFSFASPWEKVKAGLTVAELGELLGQPIRRSNPDGVFKPNVMYRWVYGYVAKKSDVFPEDVAFSVRLMKGEVSSKEDPFGGVALSQDGSPTVPKLMTPPDSTVFTHYPRLLDLSLVCIIGRLPHEV